MQQWPRATGALAYAARQHLDGRVEVGAIERRVGGGAAHQREQIVLAPRLAGALRDDLLRQHVERRAWLHDVVQPPRAGRTHERGAFDQLVARGREEPPLRSQPERVPGASDALQERRDAAR